MTERLTKLCREVLEVSNLMETIDANKLVKYLYQIIDTSNLVKYISPTLVDQIHKEAFNFMESLVDQIRKDLSVCLAERVARLGSSKPLESTKVTPIRVFAVSRNPAGKAIEIPHEKGEQIEQDKGETGNPSLSPDEKKPARGGYF